MSTPVPWRLASGVCLLLSGTVATAQGITGAAIRGSVEGIDGDPLDGARITVVHASTGYSVEVLTSRGRFLIQGLEAGGPYTVVAHRIGYAEERREGLMLTLGQLADLTFVMRTAPVALDAVQIQASTEAASLTHGGTGMTIGDSMLHRLPTLDRGLYDFVRLVPQISTKIGLGNAGFSGGGMGFRFNDFLLNGVSERTLSGSVSNAFAGAKSIPLDAVQEYQVLLSPYDVRYGGFSGAMVNVVTRSGTNDVDGSAFAYARNDRLARGVGLSPATAYEQLQYGTTLGGPIARDRVHAFVATEFRHLTAPAPGPYVGQPPATTPVVPVADSILDRFRDLLSGYQLSAGSPGGVEIANPLRNVFARADAIVPEWRSRVVGWVNLAHGDDRTFSRASPDTFSLSSYQVERESRSAMAAVQVHTQLPRAGGGHNELLVSHRSQRLEGDAAVDQPLIRVSVPAVSGGRVTLLAGTPETAQGSGGFASRAIAVRDNLTIPLGASHVLTMGAEAERFRIRRGGVTGAYGAWTFASLDALAQGVADRYELGVDLGLGDTPLEGTQVAAYVGDQWRAHSDLSITLGLRADRLAVAGRAPYHSGVDSLFGRRTDRMPRRRIELAPRLGFIWNPAGDERHAVRGGAGIFTSRYPLAWPHTSLTSFGFGGGFLRCGRSPQDGGLPPAFSPDHLAPPTACEGGDPVSATRRGDVDLLADDLRMMRVIRSSLAYDRALAGGWRLTTEALISRALSDFVFVNLNLEEPAASDRNGRIMYGTIGPTGVASPVLRSGFSEVIEVRNTPRTRAYQLSARVEKTVGERLQGTMAYTWSRVRDAQTPLRVNTRGTVAWSTARVLSGRHDDSTPGISSNDIPHRLVLAGVFTTPRRWRTEFAVYYVGESGRPFTYISSGTLRRGDLNADGSNANDPVYVPRNAFDSTEIRFEGTPDEVAAQQGAFDALIGETRCLRRQRGRLLERNSCREPWSSTTIAAVRQSIPIRRSTIEAELDLFNVLNLLNRRWGLRREAVPVLLQHVGQTAEPVETSQGIFRFDPTAPRWMTVATESAFQFQFALRYRF